MKKGLLVCLSVAISIGAIAQSAVNLPTGFRRAMPTEKMKNHSILIPYKKGIDNGIPSNNLQSRRYTAPQPGNTINTSFLGEDVIGFTFYDLQTNATTSNRIVRNPDGTISAVWTFSPDAIQTPSIFPNRGTGYNYYNGTTWGPAPSARIDAVRTGFTNIAVTASGKEMTVQHFGTGMSMNWRATKGSGSWTTSYPWGQGTNDTWPKMVAGKNSEYVYAVWQGSGVSGTPVDGQDGPIYFTRSTDGGQTWSTKAVISAIDSTFYTGFGGDNYSIDASDDGQYVAIAFSDITTDVGLLKSSDYGQTWTKTIIQQFPIPMFDLNSMITDTNNDGTVDTLNTNSGDAHVMLDNQNMAHVWFSDYRWYCDQSTPGSFNYFPSTDGMFYWNENMAAPGGYVLMATAEDLNGNGFIDTPLDETCSGDANGSLAWGQYRGGITQMPSSGIDASGRLYLTYQTIDENADTTAFFQAHRHVYMTTLDFPYTGNWTYPYDVVPTSSEVVGADGENQEAVFGSMPKFVDNIAAVLYQRDNAPGHALAAANTCDQINNLGNPSDIVYARLDAATVSVNSVDKKDVFVGQNYPNPASNLTFINIALKKSSDVVLTVTNMLGKVVYNEVQSNLKEGANTVGLNVSNWGAGVYTYTVIADGQKISKQMIVR